MYLCAVAVDCELTFAALDVNTEAPNSNHTDFGRLKIETRQYLKQLSQILLQITIYIVHIQVEISLHNTFAQGSKVVN